MNRDQQQIWLDAYNAALTGFLAGGKSHQSGEVAQGCVSLAERALEAFVKRWQPEKPPPFKGGVAV